MSEPLSETQERLKKAIQKLEENGELDINFSKALKDGICALLFVFSLWCILTGKVFPRIISSIILGWVMARYLANEFSLTEDRLVRSAEELKIDDSGLGVDDYMNRTPDEIPSIFVSYSRKDKDYVTKLVEALTNKGFSVWLDERIDYGAFWSRVIEEQLTSCDAFVLVMTSRSRESHWVTCELNYALEKKKPIFPILLEGNRWLDVASVQTFSVEDRSLPPDQFFDAINLGISSSKVSKSL